MFAKRFVSRLFLFAMAAAVTLAGQLGSANAAPTAGTATIIAWNGIAQQAAVRVAKQFIPQSLVYISFEQVAVYDAVVSIEGQYQPYKLHLRRRPHASVDAAVATAAHAVLVHYFPAQQATLDADYAASLAGIPDGSAKTDGITAGQEAAAGIIALRQGDGLEANIGFTMPAPGPGIWQLPPGVMPQTPWLSKLRPFMLTSPDQFRPGPPTALTSPQWAAEFNETKLFGSSTSPVRTAEQTDIARFWTSNTTVQYNNLFQQLALARGLSAVQTARLFAMGDLVGSDALIACFDAKYHYVFWRPQFAIPLGDTDGNPDTIGDPTWTPAIATPNHPEYPSAHGCFTGAEAEVLTTFVGTPQIDVDIMSTVPGLIHPTHHFASANDWVQEVVNARVWGGIHYRGSVLTGVDLGHQVAQWSLAGYFLPSD